MIKQILSAAAISALGFGALAGVANAAPTAHVAGPYVGPGNTTWVDDGEYMVKSDDFGGSTYLKALPQGFNVDYAAPASGWNAFPYIGRGCSHWTCTTNWAFPQARSDGSPRVDDYTTNTGRGSYNDSLDIWFSTYKDRLNQNNGAEVMIWLAHPGIVLGNLPTVWIDGTDWKVMSWRAHNSGGSWNYIAYIRVHQTSSLVDLKLNPFFWNAESRGSLNKNWYWTNIDAGFELAGHDSGTGLAVKYFSEWSPAPHKDAPKPKKVTPVSTPTTKKTATVTATASGSSHSVPTAAAASPTQAPSGATPTAAPTPAAPPAAPAAMTPAPTASSAPSAAPATASSPSATVPSPSPTSSSSPTSPSSSQATSTLAAPSGWIGCSQLGTLWLDAGGSPSTEKMAESIAMAESGGRQYATDNDGNGSVDRGYWQINSVNGALSTYSPIGNAEAAVQMSSDGTNWSPWVTYQTGAYEGKC